MDPMADVTENRGTDGEDREVSDERGRAEREHGKSHFDQSPSTEMTRPDSIAAS